MQSITNDTSPGGYADTRWSPDGTKIVASTNHLAQGLVIVTVNADGTSFAQLTTPLLNGQYDIEPSSCRSFDKLQ
jgi:Tol biopolymer transport system component